jgi:nicotinamidase-related amidase
MSDTAVLVVDMRNIYQHPDAEVLVPNVEKIIDSLADLAAARVKPTTSTWCMSTTTTAISPASSPTSSTLRSMTLGPISRVAACLTKVRHSAFG